MPTLISFISGLLFGKLVYYIKMSWEIGETLPEVMAGGSCSIYSAINKILNLVQHCEVGSRFVIHIHICKSAARM